jgi:hypothetical protein
MAYCGCRYDPSTSLFAGADPATLQALLSQAQQAYAQLIMGGKPVTVSYESKSVTYTQAEVANLSALIMQLQAQLGLTCGRRALRPYL